MNLLVEQQEENLSINIIRLQLVTRCIYLSAMSCGFLCTTYSIEIGEWLQDGNALEFARMFRVSRFYGPLKLYTVDRKAFSFCGLRYGYSDRSSELSFTKRQKVFFFSQFHSFDTHNQFFHNLKKLSS